MKLMIGVPTAEFARQAMFYDYLNMISKPSNTLLTSIHGQSPARARNVIIQGALDNDCTHILFIDDDTLPPRDIFEKLVRHDKDMVTGIYPMRNFPNQTILFDYFDEKGSAHFMDISDYPEDAFIEVVAGGLGACLIKTSVFKAMEKPWITLGELEKDHWCDDLSFFRRAKQAGFKLYADLSVRSSHMGTVLIKNDFKDGRWIVSYDTLGPHKLSFPMLKQAPEMIGAK